MGITVLVYGVVGVLVKMDDIGLNLAQRSSAGVAKLGRGLVRGMPWLLAAISVVGTAAMLWGGGHILLVGTDELGWHGPYELVHHLEEVAHSAAGALGGLVGWLAETLASAAVGLAVGGVLVLVLALVAKARGKSPAAAH